MLAAGCHDSKVVILTHKDDDTWHEQSFDAHSGGCNAVSWGPDLPTGELLTQRVPGPVPTVRQLVTGGLRDNSVKVWREKKEKSDTWDDVLLDGHSDSVWRVWLVQVSQYACDYVGSRCGLGSQPGPYGQHHRLVLGGQGGDSRGGCPGQLETGRDYHLQQGTLLLPHKIVTESLLATKNTYTATSSTTCTEY